jgi:glycosyltransferase involved in cell wall biosynthesis
VIPHDRDEIVAGVRIHAIPKPRNRLTRMLGGPQRVLREALRLRADVYHFHDPDLIPVGLILKGLGKRVIYDVHEDVPKSILGKRYLPNWLIGPLAVATGAVEKSATQAFDLVILARDDIEESFRNHARTILVRNYPKRDVFATRERVERSDGEFVVVYSGGLTPGRGAVEMVEALSLVPERCRARLVIYGRFWPDDLEERLRSLPGFGNVDYRGWVEHQTLPVELARADAGIVCFLPEPNHVNAGPTKLFEYMAAGLPVVASRFPMWRDVVEGKDCGICVDPAEPREIAAALEYLADNRHRAVAMGENGRRAVLTEYNWEAEAERLVRAYRELLGA